MRSPGKQPDMNRLEMKSMGTEKTQTKDLRSLYDYGRAYLSGKEIADAPVDAWLLLQYVTGISRARFLSEPKMTVPEKEQNCYLDLLEKRGRHIPLQHLTGEQEFMGFSFLVNCHVLIPRQDTEVLVEEALKCVAPGMKILDLCTGSGCIAISLAKLGDGISVDGADVSEDALLVARENAERLQSDVQWMKSDLFSDIEKVYDLIVSNPPYIPTAVIGKLDEEVRIHEPFLALDGREDGLYFYRRITEEARDHLKEGGWLLFEIGCEQADAVTELLRLQNYREIRVVRDLAGLDRVVIARKQT